MTFKNSLKIFISYSHKDSEFTSQLFERLTAMGHLPWMDREDIHFNGAWADQIGEALKKADVVMAVITAASMASENVKDELEYARQFNKIIIPLRLEVFPLPVQFVRRNYLDFAGADPLSAWTELEKSLAKLARPGKDVFYWDQLVPFLPSALREKILHKEYQAGLYAGHLSRLLTTAATFLPPHLAASLLQEPLSAEEQIRGEFLEGTLLMASLVPAPEKSSSAQNSKELAEAALHNISRCLEVILPVLSQLGGQFIRFSGDMLLCLFPGTPQGALNSVAAALEMKRRLAEVQVSASQEILGLDLRSGSHRGQLFSAVVGAPDHLQYILTGRALDITEQARQAASAGEIFISQDILERIHDKIEVRDLDQKQGFVKVVDLLDRPAGEALADWEGILQKIKQIGDDIPTLLASLEAITPHLPAGLLAQLVFDPEDSPISGQYRQVSIAAVSCSGISDLMASYGPQDSAEITRDLNLLIRAFQTEVHDYGGSVIRLDLYNPGDLLLAVFGAPIAHEKDGLRAALAAAGMMNALQGLPSHISAFISLKIGIHTGFAFAGTIGSGLAIQRSYSVFGSTVRAAESLMAAAEPGQVLVSRPAWQVIQASFTGQPADRQISLPGEGLLPVMVLGQAGEGSPERAAPLEAAPRFIGRAAELEKLDFAYRTAINHAPFFVAVRGDAGVGKSRLILEWMERCAREEEAVWIRAGAHSFGQKANGLFVEVLERVLKFVEADPPKKRLDRLFDALKQFHAGEAGGWLKLCQQQQALLGNFLGLDLTSQPELRDWLTGLGAESLQNATYQAVYAFLRQAAQVRPLVLILDDLHWADGESLKLLQFIVEAVDVSLPVLFCLVYRDLKESLVFDAWYKISASGMDHELIELREFNPAESQQLIQDCLEAAPVPAVLAASIQKRTDGNPLYIQELLKMLVESGELTRQDLGWSASARGPESRVPDSLYQILQSRIDELDFFMPGSRQLLCAAAVIGDECREELLRRVFLATGRTEAEYSTQLKALRRAAILVKKEIPGAVWLAFRHSLLQMVAYENMPLSQQRRLHAVVGRCLEEMYPVEKDRQADLLAYHFDAGGQWSRAFQYHLRAGENDARLYANDSAGLHLRRALELAGLALPSSLDLGRVHAWLGGLLALAGDFKGALDHFDRVIELLAGQPAEDAVRLAAHTCYEVGRVYERLGGHEALEKGRAWQEQGLRLLAGQQTAEAALLHILGAILAIRWPDFGLAAREVETALQIAGQANSRPELALAQRMAGISARAQGQLAAARQHCQQAAALCEELGDRIGQAKDLGNLGVVALEMDDWPAAAAAYHQALALQDQIGDRYQAAMTCCNLGDLCFHTGELEPGLALARRGLEVFRKIGSVEGELFSYNVLGTLYWRVEDLPAAENALLEAAHIDEKMGGSEFRISINRWLAQVYLSQGRLDDARMRLEYLEGLSAEELWSEGLPVARLGAEYSGLAGDPVEASRRLAERIANPQQGDSQFELAWARFSLAKWLRRAGKAEEARQQASQAGQAFEVLGAEMDGRAVASWL